MIRYLLALILLWLIAGCSPEKLLQMAEKKGAKVTTDTVFQDVRVFVPQVRHDTTFRSLPGDTVVLTKDRLQVKYVRLPGDSVFIEGTCLPDTVRISVPVTVTRTISAGFTKLQLIGSVVGALLFFALVLYGVYRILKLKRE